MAAKLRDSSIVIGSPFAGFYRSYGKRALDLLICAILGPPVLLVVAMLYLLVRGGGKPGFFGHLRVGRHGRVFRCWKLRTMVPNAQALLDEYLKKNLEAAAEWQKDCKLREDPRVTRLGSFLRKVSLDELPQIWNVIKGEMSFVGPRPVTQAEIERYAGHEWSYLSVRPGLTGLWQVSGRNSTAYDMRVALDAEYASRCSLFMDLVIIYSTFGVVLKRTGC
jgi:lipopolysaccharide/colanic/teichoic acid biosynthesis glycosyltransferase